MHKYILWLALCAGVVELASAHKAEAVDNHDPVKIVASPGDVAPDSISSEKDVDFLADKINLEAVQQPVANRNALLPRNPVAPTGVSLEEFLEHGMVPVEDIEAKLAEQGGHVGQKPAGPKSRYYTVYARSGVSLDNAADNGESTDSDENQDDEDDDLIDEYEDDDSEETDI